MGAGRKTFTCETLAGPAARCLEAAALPLLQYTRCLLASTPREHPAAPPAADDFDTRWVGDPCCGACPVGAAPASTVRAAGTT